MARPTPGTVADALYHGHNPFICGFCNTAPAMRGDGCVLPWCSGCRDRFLRGESLGGDWREFAARIGMRYATERFVTFMRRVARLGRAKQHAEEN